MSYHNVATLPSIFITNMFGVFTKPHHGGLFSFIQQASQTVEKNKRNQFFIFNILIYETMLRFFSKAAEKASQDLANQRKK